MAQFQIFKETSLPASLKADQIYLIADQENENYVEVYVTQKSGKARRSFSEKDAKILIEELKKSQGSLKVVQSITERDLLTAVVNGSEVYVIDASQDSTVTRGGARYLRNNNAWVKISETEQMDLNLSWANLADKPSSTVAQIDQAVQNMHSHENKTVLDQLNEDASGALTYKGKAVKTQWDSVSW